MKKRIAGALLLAALAGAAVAAVPEGKGSLGLGLGLGQENTVSSSGPFYYAAHTPYQATLQGDSQIWSGLSAGVNLSASNSPYNIHTPGPGIEENVAVYGLGAELRAYPAAFLGRAFKPGDNANPDGWLLWPSLTLHYGYSKVDDFNKGWVFGPFNSEADLFSTYQELGCGLTLPVTAWLSARAAYLRNTEEDLDYKALFGANGTLQTGGAYEAESLGLSGFINLAPGAGADAERAFVPHLGRLGQLRVDFDWSRRIDLPLFPLTSQVLGTQTYTLALGTPLTRSLGLGVSAAYADSDKAQGGLPNVIFGPLPNRSRSLWHYGLNLTWAFGDPAKRAD